MKKFINVTTCVLVLSMLATMACGCSGKSEDEEIVDESIVTEAEATEEETTATEATSAAAEETTATTAEATTAATTAAASEATTEATSVTFGDITDEMALDGIHNRCILENPDNLDLGADHWIVESSSDSEVVVLFIAYTGAEIRYYIDRATGNTHVTEFVEGIHEEEQPSDESFNVKDYITAEIYG